MSSITFLVLTSNSAAFPAGSQVDGYINYRELTELAGLEVERITSVSRGAAVLIQTALGYQFTVGMNEYRQVAPNEEIPPA
jgi:hypothetical protein